MSNEMLDNATRGRGRLMLPAKEAAAKPQPATKPAAKKPANNGKSYVRDIREFEMQDGRPVAIHRHTISFVAPWKNDPDNATLIGVRGGKGAMPIKASYATVLRWWVGGND